MTHPVRLCTAIFAAAITMTGLTACGGDNTAEAKQNSTVVVADVSGSAEMQSLRDSARAQFVSAVKALQAPGSVTLFAFNTKVGSTPCDPVVAKLAASDNSTRIEDDRSKLVAQAPSAAAPYFDCVRKAVSLDGTDVFGGFAEAANLLKNATGTKAIVMVTDGCNNSFGLVSCSAEVADPAWRAEKLKALPESLKPNLAGISVTISDLARGADLQSDQVQGLRALYTEYGALTGASIQF